MPKQESTAKRNKYLREECLKFIYEKTEGNLLNRYSADEARSEFEQKYSDADFNSIMYELYQKKMAQFAGDGVSLLKDGIREIERIEKLSPLEMLPINVNQINNSRVNVRGSFAQGSSNNKIKVSDELKDDESLGETIKDIIDKKPAILIIIVFGIISLLYAYKSGFPVLEFVKVIFQG